MNKEKEVEVDKVNDETASLNLDLRMYFPQVLEWLII